MFLLLRILAFVVGVVLVGGVLLDCFESIVLPRRVTHPYRYARMFYRYLWLSWRRLARIFTGRQRETFLSCFGPIALLTLFASWGLGLIAGFSLLSWGLALPLQGVDGHGDFATYVYLSGTTFFTLGFGDVTPTSPLGRLLAVGEAGLGFSFLAVVISYLPVFYQAFSRRELLISLLDARAGSPPSAGEALRRAAQARKLPALTPLLADGERWAAEVLESHLSYPVLSYFRSQHDNQSWLAALTMLLDTAALLLASGKSGDLYQAQMTFAMARHVVVDLALVFRLRPQPAEERLAGGAICQLLKDLNDVGFESRDAEAVCVKLTELHAMYAPFVIGLAEHFQLVLPPVVPTTARVDNWQTSAWMRRTPGIGGLPGATPGDDHFD